MTLRARRLAPIVRGMQDWVVSLPIGRYLVRQPVGAEHDVDVVPGLRHDMVQSFDLVVSQGTPTQLYTVVVGTMLALSEHDRAIIARALLATRRPEVVFLLEAKPGSGAAEYTGSADPSAAAVAVGVVGATLGWPRGEPLTIGINGRHWTVTARLEDQRWRCQATPSA